MKDLPEIRTKLLAWYFAVGWSRVVLERSVQVARENNWTNSYEELQVERLLDLEQFLKMTWDEAMEKYQDTQEVK
jgi:hypothetical protein